MDAQLDLEARAQHYSSRSSEIASQVLAARQKQQLWPFAARPVCSSVTAVSRLVLRPGYSAVRVGVQCLGPPRPVNHCPTQLVLAPLLRPATTAQLLAPLYTIDAVLTRQARLILNNEAYE